MKLYVECLGKSRLFKDKRILLLESAPQKSYTPSPIYSNRVSALSPASKQFLDGKQFSLSTAIIY